MLHICTISLFKSLSAPDLKRKIRMKPLPQRCQLVWSNMLELRVHVQTGTTVNKQECLRDMTVPVTSSNTNTSADKLRFYLAANGSSL